MVTFLMRVESFHDAQKLRKPINNLRANCAKKEESFYCNPSFCTFLGNKITESTVINSKDVGS